jgi:RNA polymerase sigma factor (sigma-70 family)
MSLIIQKSESLEQLIKGCQKSDPKAQRLLYQQFNRRMFAICKRYLSDPFEAEDAMINGFMKVYGHIRNFEGTGSFEGWMKRIMVNESLSMIRKKKTMHVELDQAELEGELSYDSLAAGLHADELMKLIEELPIGYRTVFNLYAIEGYQHKEIAEMLEIGEGTSKSQLSRARTLLQQALLRLEAKPSISRNHE